MAACLLKLPAQQLASPLAAAVLWFARSVAVLNRIQAGELQTALSDAGFSQMESMRALGELDAVNVVWFAFCTNTGGTFVQLANIEDGMEIVGLREGLEAMTA